MDWHKIKGFSFIRPLPCTLFVYACVCQTQRALWLNFCPDQDRPMFRSDTDNTSQASSRTKAVAARRKIKRVSPDHLFSPYGTTESTSFSSDWLFSSKSESCSRSNSRSTANKATIRSSTLTNPAKKSESIVRSMRGTGCTSPS